MFIIIWQYQVKEKDKLRFEAIYSADGEWADLFKKSAGYLGTELFQDSTNAELYLTIDHWMSREAYQDFQAQWQEEYKLLDKKCAGLTEFETLLGKWNLK